MNAISEVHVRAVAVSAILAIVVTACSSPSTAPADRAQTRTAWMKGVPENPTLRDIGDRYYLLLHEISHGNTEAVQLGLLIVSSPEAKMSARPDDIWQIAEVLYDSELEQRRLWADVEKLSMERQRALINLFDYIYRSPCYTLVDWEGEREEFVRTHPNAAPTATTADVQTR